MHARTLSLMVTLACDAKCDHCAVFAAPNRRERMSDDTIHNAIDQANAVRSIQLVAFTGGEPMLDYQRLRQMVGYTSRNGLQSGIVSNSSWASTPEIADARLSELKGLGLSMYITSLDEFHARYIAVDRVRNAVRSGLRQGLTVHINALWTPGFEKSLGRLPGLLGLPSEVIDGKGRYGLYIWMSLPAARRRAGTSNGSVPLALGDPRNAGPCSHILRHPVVAVDGSVHACCGVADTTPYGPARFSLTGCLKQASLRSLLNDMQHNLLFNLLARMGPNALLVKLRSLDHGLPDTPSSLNPCEMCALLRQSPWCDALERYLLDLRTGAHAANAHAA